MTRRHFGATSLRTDLNQQLQLRGPAESSRTANIPSRTAPSTCAYFQRIFKTRKSLGERCYSKTISLQLKNHSSFCATATVFYCTACVAALQTCIGASGLKFYSRHNWTTLANSKKNSVEPMQKCLAAVRLFLVHLLKEHSWVQN